MTKTSLLPVIKEDEVCPAENISTTAGLGRKLDTWHWAHRACSLSQERSSPAATESWPPEACDITGTALGGWRWDKCIYQERMRKGDKVCLLNKRQKSERYGPWDFRGYQKTEHSRRASSGALCEMRPGVTGDLRDTARHPQPFLSSFKVHPHLGFACLRDCTKDGCRLRIIDSH